jgi:mRNA interferase RelE/StbE
MRYEIVFAPEAAKAFGNPPAYNRAEVRGIIEKHLRYESTRISKSRIKHLRGLAQPQYRLRVGEVRVFYDVTSQTVEILAIVTKAEAASWLAEHGTPDAPGSSSGGEG